MKGVQIFSTSGFAYFPEASARISACFSLYGAPKSQSLVLIAPCPSSLQQQQNVLNNNGKKPPSSRREKERRRDRKSESSHDGGESKENQEAQVEPLGELAKDGETKVAQEVKSGALKKRGGEGEDSFLPPSSPLRGALQVIPQCAVIYLHYLKYSSV